MVSLFSRKNKDVRKCRGLRNQKVDLFIILFLSKSEFTHPNAQTVCACVCV